MIGACAADGVIGAGREQQGGPALSLLAVNLPDGARVTPFHALIGEEDDGLELVGCRRRRRRTRGRDRRPPFDSCRGAGRRLERRARAGRIRRARRPWGGTAVHERRLRQEGAVGIVLEGFP